MILILSMVFLSFPKKNRYKHALSSQMQCRATLLESWVEA